MEKEKKEISLSKGYSKSKKNVFILVSTGSLPDIWHFIDKTRKIEKEVMIFSGKRRADKSFCVRHVDGGDYRTQIFIPYKDFKKTRTKIENIFKNDPNYYVRFNETDKLSTLIIIKQFFDKLLSKLENCIRFIFVRD